jgi:hypothetical protein
LREVSACPPGPQSSLIPPCKMSVGGPGWEYLIMVYKFIKTYQKTHMLTKNLEECKTKDMARETFH